MKQTGLKPSVGCNIVLKICFKEACVQGRGSMPSLPNDVPASAPTLLCAGSALASTFFFLPFPIQGGGAVKTSKQVEMGSPHQYATRGNRFYWPYEGTSPACTEFIILIQRFSYMH